MAAVPIMKVITKSPSSNDIDDMIAMEMQHFKDACRKEEEIYIEEEMERNPIELVNRLKPTDKLNGESKHTEKYKRSEACRRSRINRKIRNMKSKYRHDFIAEKLKLTTHYLEYIRKVIMDTETQLIEQGVCSAERLYDLRKNFKIFHHDMIENGPMED